jgi:flagellar protein FlaG
MSIESISGSIGAQRPPVQDGIASRPAEHLQRAAPKKPEEVVPAEIQANAANSQRSKNEQPAVEAAVQQIADFVNKTRPELSFSVDEASGVRVVRIIDTTTKEVIRQYPSEEAIQLAQALDKLQGLLVRDKA